MTVRRRRQEKGFRCLTTISAGNAWHKSLVLSAVTTPCVCLSVPFEAFVNSRSALIAVRLPSIMTCETSDSNVVTRLALATLSPTAFLRRCAEIRGFCCDNVDFSSQTWLLSRGLVHCWCMVDSARRLEVRRTLSRIRHHLEFLADLPLSSPPSMNLPRELFPIPASTLLLPKPLNFKTYDLGWGRDLSGISDLITVVDEAHHIHIKKEPSGTDEHQQYHDPINIQTMTRAL